MQRSGKIRTYSELMQINGFEDRFRYLALHGSVGEHTFGGSRWLNQEFYHSDEWASIRRKVILRDSGCDLAIPGREIDRGAVVHHMNPMTISDVMHSMEILLDPEYLITVSSLTHKAIHYSDISLLPTDPVQRRPFDTCPWRR